tara:strand:+ start:163 stop:495 length:333 start_codon:yes stop_codon:yes gene_type:complete
VSTTVTQKQYRLQEARNVRLSLVALLGDKCNCNGINCWHKGPCDIKDKRILQIDHINGGGWKELQACGSSRYRDYLKDPDMAKQRLQVLCANCNWTKRVNNKEIRNGKKE